MGLTPRMRVAVQPDNPVGTGLWTGKLLPYRFTTPMATCPTARVTMRALSLSPPIRIPLTSPMRAAAPRAVTRASSDPVVRLMADTDHDHRCESQCPGNAEVDPTVHDHQHLAQRGHPEQRPERSYGTERHAAQSVRGPNGRHSDEQEHGQIDRQIPGRHDERGEGRGWRAVLASSRAPVVGPDQESGGKGHPPLGGRRQAAGLLQHLPRGLRCASRPALRQRPSRHWTYPCPRPLPRSDR